MRLLFITLCVAAAYVYAILNNDDFYNRKDTSQSELIALLDQHFPDKWLEVPLDHFNLFDNRTWRMRYKVSNRFFKPGNPIFIEIGGEWTIHGVYFIDGQLKKLAEKHNGMLVETEHRYYGKSLPFGNNFTTENLKYLQIEQALEDIAYFIEHFKTITPGAENSKVIIHGCSYPGRLVTWMRLRFPHIVDIAYASSAPLGAALEYPQFYEVVNDVYANVSSDCIDTIRSGFQDTEELMSTTAGRKRVRNALRKWNCGNVDEMNTYDILKQYTNILNVMHDPVHYEDVGCLVLLMDADDTEPFERLANFITLKSKDRRKCPEPDEDEAGEDVEAANADEMLSEDDRTGTAWSYQKCTEMGSFTTLNTTNPRHPFRIDLNVHDSVEACVEDFGGDERSHCIDISERKDDPQDLHDLRKKIRDQISQWIEEIS